MFKRNKIKIWSLLGYIPLPKIIWRIFFNFINRKIRVATANYQVPVTFDIWYNQFIYGQNRHVPWPVHHSSVVSGVERIYSGIETSPGYMSGCYIQGYGGIYFGDYTQVGPNVSVISANHDINDTRATHYSPVRIGKYCWLGSGAIILPGVTLGDHTIVGAGSVVTKSFPGGYCIIAGNPARVIKKVDEGSVTEYELNPVYFGYYSEAEYKQYSKGIEDPWW